MLIDDTPFSWFPRRQNAATYGDSSNHSIAAQRPSPSKPFSGLISRSFTKRLQQLAIFILLSVLATACAAPADEVALRAQIDAMVLAVEARDSDALLASVDDEFSGPDGMDRAGLRRYAVLMLLRQQRVGVVLGPVEVQIYGDRASARFDALVTGANRFMPEGLEARRVETVWRRDGDAWLLVSADWSKPALGG